jgi:hypothetical protein
MTSDQPLPARQDIAAKVGVLLYHATSMVDAVLAEAVRRVRDRGIAVGGVMQRTGDLLSNGKHSLWLDDIATGDAIRLDRPRGPGAKDCVLDTDALAQAAGILRRATEAGARLIVVNRFGHTETEGSGMRAEIADAIFSGAVVLIPVRASRLDDLEAFLGGPAAVMQQSPAAIADWVEQAMVIRHPAGV